MKKTKFLFVLSVVAAGVLASCGERDKSSAGGTDVPSSSDTSSKQEGHQDKNVMKEKVEITMWHNSSYTDQLDDIINRFKEVEPNITVTHVKQTGNYDAVKEMIVQGIPANNYPDLYMGYPDSVQEIMNYGKVVQLDSYIDNPVYGWTAADKKDIVEAYLEEGKNYPVEGTWSLPAAKSTEAMYYNKDVLIGLDLSKEDATINGGQPLTVDYINNLTWEELFDHLCPAIIAYNNKLPDGEKIYLTDYNFHSIFGYDSDDNLFITLAEQYGYGYTSIDQTTGEGSIDFVNDGMKSLMKKLNGPANTDYLMTKGTAGNYTNYAFVVQNALFSIGSTGGSKYQIASDKRFETGVAKIPHAEGRDQKVINQGPSMSILDHNDANRALASWLFYRFFSNAQNDLYWSTNTSYSPIRYSTYDSSAYQEFSDPSAQPDKSAEKLYAEVAAYNSTVTNDLYISPVFKGSSTARTQASSIVTQILKTPTAELNDAKVNEIFDKAKEEVLKKM